MVNNRQLSAMPWVGGKSINSPNGTGKWIANLLPYGESYCEPFAGMLGVLLQRTPSAHEVVNDLDQLVINWWRVVREHPKELSWAVYNTPKSRGEYVRALRHMKDPNSTPFERARDFTICVGQAMAGRFEESAWGIRATSHGYVDWRWNIHERLQHLADRMRHVQLECRDAVEVMERFARADTAVLYVDPPYAGTYGYDGAYAHTDDRAALTEALRAQQGKVAVSGYGEEWDELGWQRHEWPTRTSNAGANTQTARTEVLWTNFKAHQQGSLL